MIPAPRGRACLATCAAFTLFACSDGNDGPPGPAAPPGPNPSTLLGDFDPLPGVQVAITQVSGGSGSNGTFNVGDRPIVRFTAMTSAGDYLNVNNLGGGTIYLSGPTTNYQRVIAEQDDLRSKAVYEQQGIWYYQFTTPIPSTYLAPFNDSAAFGAADGELAGQSLLAGTYTIGLELRQTYTAKGTSFVDAGVAVQDVLFGGATVLAPRQVVNVDNCNVCHTELRAHGGRKKDPRLCVLCHTAGAEDSNDGGGTPGVSIEFVVMIHRLHQGQHLPSVLGVTTAADGSRVYPGMAGAVAPRPVAFLDSRGGVTDFSYLNFPVFPNYSIATPRDAGYSALSSTDPDGSGPLLSPRGNEDRIRRGITACGKCHGDPDGSGPRTAPAQGDRHRTAPTRRACGSCHDDVDWTRPYTANGQTMAADRGDETCSQCHTDVAANQSTASLKPLSVAEAHLHPLSDPTVDAGVVVNVTAVTGGTLPNGNFQAGDAPTAVFTLKNDAGTDLGVASMDSASAFFLGPTTNRQLVMPPATANGVALNPFDFTGRVNAVSTGNKGTMSKVFLGTPAAAETLTVEFTSATAFTVTGSVSGALGSGTLPASPGTQASGSSLANFDLSPSLATGTVQITFSDATHFTLTGAVTGSGTLPAATSASTRFVSTDLSFNITVGSTAFLAGNTFQIGLFRGTAANPVGFAIVAGRTAFSAAAGARDRFYYEVVPNATSYALPIPMDLVYEFLADSTGSAGQVLPAAANLPVYFGRQQLNEATLAAATAVTSEAVTELARSVAIAPVTGFANNDIVVVDPAAGVGTREYVQIQPVKADGSTAGSGDTTVRIYFRTALRYAHNSGVTVRRVTLVFKQEGASNAYTLDGTTGVITSTGAFTAGTALVLSYRSQARFGYRRHNGDPLQSYYTAPPNDTDAPGEEQGDWHGLPYQDGTYTVDLWLYKSVDVALHNELQTYRSTSTASTKDFLFGAATTIVPHAIISSAANCNTCHDDVSFHGGGRRGAEACVTCHSLSGGMSHLVGPANDPPEPIEFRQMLHKIHMAEDLTYHATYAFAVETGFPALPGKVRQCVRCHGNEAWKEPAPRVHAAATTPVRVWGTVCGSCHDNDAAQAHISLNTPGAGTESCSVCHGTGSEFAVEKVHRAR